MAGQALRRSRGPHFHFQYHLRSHILAQIFPIQAQSPSCHCCPIYIMILSDLYQTFALLVKNKLFSLLSMENSNGLCACKASAAPQYPFCDLISWFRVFLLRPPALLQSLSKAFASNINIRKSIWITKFV